MKVRRLPKDSGPAAWSALLPPAPPARPLEAGTTADWLVIGAGFAGLAAARRLTQVAPGARVAVLEASRVGEGPAGRNSGFMIDLPHDLASENYGGDAARDLAQTRANRAAIAFALDAAREYDMPAEAVRPVGKINVAATARGVGHNRAYAAHLAALDEPHELYDAARMREITGSDYYLNGLYTPGTAMLQPALYVRELAAGLTRAGVALHEASPVIALDRQGGAWTVSTPRGAATAPRVILAVNGHAESFGAFRGRLVHVCLYASMTRALTPAECARLGGLPDWGGTPADPMGTTVRRVSGMGGDRIVIRNRVSYTPSLETSAARIAATGRSHDASFRARFPMLRDVGMAYRWAGRLCLSLNGAPAFGEVEPGLFAACCQNGLGAAKGTFAGMAAADLAAGVDSAEARFMRAAPGPSRLPPAPLDRIGAAARILWGERAAGAEL